MLPKIPPYLLELYKPLSNWESFYLRTRWRLCPYELVESLLPQRGKILDVGCGYGLLANLIASKCRARSVVGIDLSASRVRVAKRSVKGRSNIMFLYGDVESLEIAQYDLVVMTDVLHHMDESKAKIVLERISFSLRRNGVLVILDVEKEPFWKFYITYVIDRFLNPEGRLYYRSVPEMGRLLQSFSLAVEKIIPADKGLPLSDIIYLCKKKRD